MYRVLCQCKSVAVRTYYVFEAATEKHYDTYNKLTVGLLYWRTFIAGDYIRPVFNIPVFDIERTGGMDLKPVLPEEAETITGLYMPAAMDRLRELVHESGGDGDAASHNSDGIHMDHHRGS